MGNNLVRFYRQEIQELVDAGDGHKGAKKNAAQVQEVSRARHPGRFDIPSTYHINSCMKSYLSRGKRMTKRTPAELEKATNRKP